MSLFDETDPRQRRRSHAEQEADTAVWRIVQQDAKHAGVNPDTYTEKRELYPGAGDLWIRNYPQPQYALDAARALVAAARKQEQEALANARGRGDDWDEIGRWLRLEKAAEEANMSLGMAAWRYAAAGVMPDEQIDYRRFYYSPNQEPQFRWACYTCTGKVSESSLDNGVSDGQKGHKPGCVRLAADVAVERARWDD